MYDPELMKKEAGLGLAEEPRSEALTGKKERMSLGYWNKAKRPVALAGKAR